MLGDKEIKTCDDTNPSCGKSQPIVGTGIKVLIEKQRESIYDDLDDIYSNTIPMTIDNLELISAPGVVVTRQVIEAIRRWIALMQTSI